MHAILHVELVEQIPGMVELRLWRDDRNAALTRPLALADVEVSAVVDDALPSDEEEFASGGPDDGLVAYAGVNGLGEQGPDSRLAPVDPDEVI